MDFEVLKNMAAGVIRTMLTPVIAYLATNGYLSDSQGVQLAAILASLVVAVLWSLLSKVWANEKVETALELPGGSSKAKLNDVLAGK